MTLARRRAIKQDTAFRGALRGAIAAGLERAFIGIRIAPLGSRPLGPLTPLPEHRSLCGSPAYLMVKSEERPPAAANAPKSKHQKLIVEDEK